MYSRRITILVAGGVVLLAVCVVRLADMQLLSKSYYREQVAKLRVQKGSTQQLRTLRGRILDRHGRVLAFDEPRFWLAMSYELSRFLDERVGQGLATEAGESKDARAAAARAAEQVKEQLEDIELVMDKCAQFGMSRAEVLQHLEQINEKVWNLRTFLAWARSGPGPEILEKYNRNLNSVPFSEAIADFEKKIPDPQRRLKLITNIDDIAEMRQSWPVLELKTDEDVFAARVEFLDINGVQVVAKGQRVYPYGSTASQTIGWVGPPREEDKELFASDRLASYLDDEVCGREDGVEYVCEPILRGRRGELVYDIDRELIRQTEAQFGRDVRLTIDIELQKKVEEHLADCGANPNCRAGMAAVVIDAPSGEILVSASLPGYDLNLVRQNYGELAKDPCEPLRNRVLYREYPPGSVIKPVILTAGLESGQITTGEVISCPAKAAPQGWPSCWIYLRNNWLGHDGLWPNNARNAIKGSCNIYFSRLADRIEPVILQSWLYQFGYGRTVALCPQDGEDADSERSFRQYAGQISNDRPNEPVSSFEQLPALEPGERRWFGIGHGNMRVTPIQVANAMAAIAGGGVYKPARLIADAADEVGTEPNEQTGTVGETAFPNATAAGKSDGEGTDLKISGATLAAVYEGMHAVVEESGGTAYKEFAPMLGSFAAHRVRVYGKTGSTQKPEHAWFAGFAKDAQGRSIAIAVAVEGGQQGSADAAPLARDILQFCVEAGYIGN